MMEKLSRGFLNLMKAPQAISGALRAFPVD